MSQTRITQHLALLNETFEQRLHAQEGCFTGIRYSFQVKADEPHRMVSRLEHKGGTDSHFHALEVLDVETEHFRAFVSGMVGALLENEPRFHTDLPQPDFALLTDNTLVTEEDFHRTVAERMQAEQLDSAVFMLDQLASHKNHPLPESRPPYLNLLRALLFYERFDKDFEALLERLLEQWRALPVEEHPAATEWLVLTFHAASALPGDAIWRGQRRECSDILRSELDALHQEWHGASLSSSEDDGPGDEEALEPRVEWSSPMNAVVQVPLAHPVTWTRRFKNVGGPGAGVYVVLSGDLLETRLLEIHLALNGRSYPLPFSGIGGTARCAMPLEPGSEHALQLSFRARGPGGGFIKAGVMALTARPDSPDGMGGAVSEQSETLQLFIG
ncbi:hypothetical protein NVS55_10075 [Myxococcus stipitatus]|uniref:hypothetical protein n=1 Tax=Myxococcus stipitatus TaxID=83455 RepID=UPI0031456994